MGEWCWGGYRGLLLITLHLTCGGRFSRWTQSLLICYSGLSVCRRDPLSLPADVGITAAPPHLPGIYMSAEDLNLGSYACAADALATDPSPQPRYILGCILFPCIFFSKNVRTAWNLTSIAQARCNLSLVWASRPGPGYSSAYNLTMSVAAKGL